MPRLIRRHSLPVRLLHGLNVPVLAVMAWSGVAISAGKAPYTLSVAGQTLVFFPEIVFREIPFPDLARAIGWHFTFAWPFLGSGLLYLLWSILSGHWRAILPRRGTLRDAGRLILRDCGVTSIPPPPGGVYHGAQRIAYTLALGMLAGLGVTGLAIFRPTQLAPLVRVLGGYAAARAEHFWLTLAIVLFVGLHVLMVLRAGWNTLRSMIIGVEVIEDSPEPAEAAHAHA